MAGDGCLTRRFERRITTFSLSIKHRPGERGREGGRGRERERGREGGRERERGREGGREGEGGRVRVREGEGEGGRNNSDKNGLIGGRGSQKTSATA